MRSRLSATLYPSARPRNTTTCVPDRVFLASGSQHPAWTQRWDIQMRGAWRSPQDMQSQDRLSPGWTGHSAPSPVSVFVPPFSPGSAGLPAPFTPQSLARLWLPKGWTWKDTPVRHFAPTWWPSPPGNTGFLPPPSHLRVCLAQPPGPLIVVSLSSPGGVVDGVYHPLSA